MLYIISDHVHTKRTCPGHVSASQRFSSVHGQRAVSIIEEQWDQSVMFGTRARTRLPEKFTSKLCILSAFLSFN